MTAPTDTAVVVVNYRTQALTVDAVASALSEPEVTEVVVVDNASGDGSAAQLRDAYSGARVRIIESDRNVGFGPAVNLGAATVNTPLVLVLNSDAVLVPGAVGRLAAALFADNRVAVVAPAVYEPDGTTLQAGVYGRLPSRRDLLSSNGWVRRRGNDPRQETEPGWVSGVAMLLRTADFVAAGGFDERFTMYLEDVDLCRRLWSAGRSVRRVPEAAVVHGGGRSWRSSRERVRRFHESKLRYFETLRVTAVERACIRLTGTARMLVTRD